MSKQSVDAFWRWFSEAAPPISNEGAATALFSEIDRRLGDLQRGLSWEIGPGRTAAWSLTISPGMDSDLAASAREIVGCAPAIEGWEFYDSRQPKDWMRRFELARESGSIAVDASD